MGLSVFIRLQHTMALDRNMDSAKVFYTELHAKVMHFLEEKIKFFINYPDATFDMGNRAMCLVSDIIDKTYEVQVNIAYDRHGNTMLTLSVWLQSD